MKLSSVRKESSKPKASSSWHLPRPWTRSPSGRILLRWRAFTLYLALFLGLGWLTTSIGIFYFVKYRVGYEQVPFGQIAGLPFTLKRYRQDRGLYWVKLGKEAAKEGKWFQAFGLLRGGLPDAPEDQEARLLLARIFVMAQRPDQVRQVLLEGIPYNTKQLDYLRTVLGFLFAQQADEAVTALADDLLKRPDLPAEGKRLVSIARLYAYFNRDQFADTLRVMQSDGLAQSPEGRFIKARIEWETDNRETSLVLLKTLHGQAPQDADIYRTLIFYLRELNRLDEARRVSLSRQLQFPDNPDAYLDYISLCDDATRRESERVFVERFQTKPEALTRLAGLAARRGDADLAWFVAGLFDPKADDAPSCTLLALDAELVRGAFKEAGEKAADALAKHPNWDAPQRLALEGIQIIAFLGQKLNSDALVPLKRVLESNAIQPNVLVNLAAHAEKLGELDVARDLLDRSVKLDPLSQPALVALLSLESKRERLDEVLPLAERLPTLRKPSAKLMAEIADRLDSDRYLFLAARQPAIKAIREKQQALKNLTQSE